MTVRVRMRFPNLSNATRTEIAYATVPFAQGEWRGDVPLKMMLDEKVELDSVIEPMGAKWPDGSVRYGRSLTRLTIPGGLTLNTTVMDGKSSIDTPFTLHPAIQSLPTNSLPVVAIRIGSTWMSSSFTSGTTLIEDNRLRKVFRARERLGNFVLDLKIYLMSNQQLAKFELSIIGSNPNNTLYSYPVDEIRLAISGGNFISVRGAQKRGVSMVDPYKIYRLMGGPNYFGDGQKQSWCGEIMPALNTADVDQLSNARAAIEHCLYGMSTDWGAKGAYAAFGVIQTPERNVPSDMWNDIIRDYNNYKSYIEHLGDPWDDYLLGLTQTPGQTGGQRDFSMLEGGPSLYLGAAELLDLYYFLATEETKRPGHYFEYDCRNVTSATHPRWVTWDGRTHWHPSVSLDRLGKTDPDLGGYFHGWFGKDWEHHSSNLLTFAALMTGSHLLLDEVNTEVELYIAGHTLPSMMPGWSTNGAFAARAFGRTHHAMVSHYFLTGREDLRTRMLDRFRQCVSVQWDGATRSPVRNWLHLRDDRVLGSTIDAWVPWNESLGFVGAVALYNATHDPQVLSFLVAWSRSIMRYGWRSQISENGAVVGLQIGQGVKWNTDGSPIPPAAYFDGVSFLPAVGFESWGAGVIKIIKDNPAIYPVEDVDLATRYYNYLTLYRDQTDVFSEWGRWTAIKLQ
jgi:hypothetical protein